MALDAESFGTLLPGWKHALKTEFTSVHGKALWRFLTEEYASDFKIFPPKSEVLRALTEVDFENVNVVILGQDPYHGEGQAMGLSFAVPMGSKVPPSLRNIFKELATDLKITLPQNTTLTGWVQQGVLLLNTVLTVREGQAFSHRNKGWEYLTDAILAKLGARQKPLVFLLWGSAAHEKVQFIDQTKHLVLKAVHPSPLSAHRGFMGCKHFSKTNEFLVSRSQIPIKWEQTSQFSESISV